MRSRWSAPAVRVGSWFLFLAMAVSPVGSSGDDPDRDLVVRVKQTGELFTIEVSMQVHAPQAEVWGVLTDFDGMAKIVSNLESSRIVSRRDHRVVVEQRGSEAQGLLKFAFHSVRDVELQPYHEMRSTLITGSMRRLDGVTRLATNGRGTQVTSLGDIRRTRAASR